MQDQEVQRFEVEVRGHSFHSKEVRKVMIKVYQPMTFIQTDKPIYLPGQTGNLELMIYAVVHNMVYTIYRRVFPLQTSEDSWDRKLIATVSIFYMWTFLVFKHT